MSIVDFEQKKQRHEKISMITCYDYSSAQIAAQTSIDALLVGDSVAMTMHGFPTTLSATMEMMVMHTAAVARGAPKKFIVSDLPFLSYRQSCTDNIAAVQSLMQAGAHAVKLEGARGNTEFIAHLVESGIPVMGHLGLTPQSVRLLGGYKIQGKTDLAAERLCEDACALQEAGCFSIVLECIPRALAERITEQLTIPTIGIGAGPGTDGQILVWHDLLGLNPSFAAKFTKHFMEGHALLTAGIEQYIADIHSGNFPQHEHSF